TGSSGNWTFYNGSLSGERYSPLNEIKTANVGRLQQVCTFDTPDTVSFQSGIVAVASVLYFTAYNTTYAIDGATCRQKWKFTRPEPPTFLKVNRGVAYSGGMLFRGPVDAHVLGIEALTGRLQTEVSIGAQNEGHSVPCLSL